MDLAIKFTVSPHQCRMEPVVWWRTNRNNRIARKWRKKYGKQYGPERICRQENVTRLGNLLVCCPHQFEAMMRQTTGYCHV